MWVSALNLSKFTIIKQVSYTAIWVGISMCDQSMKFYTYGQGTDCQGLSYKITLCVTGMMTQQAGLFRTQHGQQGYE